MTAWEFIGGGAIALVAVLFNHWLTTGSIRPAQQPTKNDRTSAAEVARRRDALISRGMMVLQFVLLAGSISILQQEWFTDKPITRLSVAAIAYVVYTLADVIERVYVRAAVERPAERRRLALEATARSVDDQLRDAQLRDARYDDIIRRLNAVGRDKPPAT